MNLYSKEENKGTFKIHITNNKLKKELVDNIFGHRHFENLFLLILKECSDDFKLLSDYGIMRAVLRDTKGGKKEDGVKFIKDKYKEYDKLNELINLSLPLKVHNLSAIIKRVKGSYKSFFTKIKKGDVKARPPKAKKLKTVSRYSIPLDINSWSVKKENKIGINLSSKMFYIPFKHEFLNKITNGLENIQNISIVYSNGSIYLNVLYNKEEHRVFVQEEEKLAAIDLGIINLCGLFIDDKDSRSLILKGSNYIGYNARFNRQVAKIQKSISKEVSEWTYNPITKKKYPKEYTKRGRELKKFVSFLYEKRNRFFVNEFHKLSKRITEYLESKGVTTLVISKNLSKLKNNGMIKMRKVASQKFVQIPIIRLLDYIITKCHSRGIVVGSIDEAYTSKCSCITDDVNNPRDTELNGVRPKRGLFTDKLLNKIWNADLNGAVNHIRKYISRDFKWLLNHFHKLCNPIVMKCDYDFIKYNLVNSVSNKVST